MKRYSIFSLARNALSGHRDWPAAWRSPDPKPAYDAIIVGCPTRFGRMPSQLAAFFDQASNLEQMPSAVGGFRGQLQAVVHVPSGLVEVAATALQIRKAGPRVAQDLSHFGWVAAG